MKRKAFILAVLLFFAVTLASAFTIASRDNFSNKKNGFENRHFSLDGVGMYGWAGGDGGYVAGEASYLVLDGLGCYVHSLKIEGQVVPNPISLTVHYKKDAGGAWESKEAFCGVNGDSIYVMADVAADTLVLDFGRSPGTEVLLSGVEVNDMSLVFSINCLARYCLLPTVVFGGVMSLAFYGTNIGIYFRGLKKYLPLVGNLISRDLKVKYRRSVLGFLWSILNPLLMALVIHVVFSKIFRFQVEYFATYYLTGSLIFNFMVECTSSSLMSIISAAPLIRKVYIPKYIFPLQKCAFAFINMLFGMVAVIVVMLVQGVPFHATALLFPIPMLYTFAFSYGLGLVLAASTVYFRDIQHLYSVFTSIWMYLTPIIYPEEVLLSSRLGLVMKLNPMYYLTHSFRSVAIYGELPTVNENIMCAVFALLALVCGLGVFKKLQDRFILYI